MLNPLRSAVQMLFLACFLAVAAFAGSHPDRISSIRIATISAFHPEQAAQGEIHTFLTHWFEARGISVVDRAEWVLWFSSVVDERDTSRILLAIGLGHTLPKEAIQLGKESEVFYTRLARVNKAGQTPEGKAVREYVTECFLYEFMYPLAEKLEVIARPELLSRVEEMVQQVCAEQLKE